MIHDPKAELSEKAQTELTHIRQHTKVLTHYSDLEQLKDYPEAVRKLLKKFGRVKLDKSRENVVVRINKYTRKQGVYNTPYAFLTYLKSISRNHYERTNLRHSRRKSFFR